MAAREDSMRKRTWLYLSLGAIGLASAFAGCGGDDSTTPGGGTDAGMDSTNGPPDANNGVDANGTGDTGGTRDGNGIDGGVLGCTKKGFGQMCLVDSDCCSAMCDPRTNTCSASVVNCHGTGGPCGTGLDCCSLSCVGGACANTCTADNQACTNDAQCCGQKCGTPGPDGGMTCTPITTTCASAGNPCTPPGPDGGASAACCSGLCGANGTCQLQSSFCIQTNDICINSTDCCTGNCSSDVADAGGGVGHCINPPSLGGSNCSGAPDGVLCPGGPNGCQSCCSRLCAPYATGVNVCQPANGCHVEGDLCRDNTDCCDYRADGTGAGVTCMKAPGYPVGYCSGPNGCRPLGDTCHYKGANYTCNVSSSANDCCAIPNPSNKICAIDPLGVPRCASGVCVGPGGTCSNSLDCCLSDGGLCYSTDPDAGPASGCLPCVPGGDGGTGLVCATPNDAGTFCRDNGQSCTINADCCQSLQCYIPPGSTMGSCNPPVPPPQDAGTPVDANGIDAPPVDANMPPTCALYGQSCTTASDCCNGVPCSIGGIAACGAGQTGCTCTYIIH
jgi:hypothetical protein